MPATKPDHKAADLAKITTPTAIADGEYDEAIRQWHNKKMAAQIPGAKPVILPGVSHFAFLQKPDEFNKAVLDFVME